MSQEINPVIWWEKGEMNALIAPLAQKRQHRLKRVRQQIQARRNRHEVNGIIYFCGLFGNPLCARCAKRK